MKITKAVIPAAGFGTRFLPFTRSVPKEMIPLVDKPVIQYVIEEAAAAGITDILIVISSGKGAIQEHFIPGGPLEERLAATGKNAELTELERIDNLARIHYVYQKELNGLGHALMQAESFVGNDPFAVLLGDTVLYSKTKPVTAQLCEVFEQVQSPVVALEEVPVEKVSRYGIAGVDHVGKDVGLTVRSLQADQILGETGIRLAVILLFRRIQRDRQPSLGNGEGGFHITTVREVVVAVGGQGDRCDISVAYVHTVTGIG